MVPRESRGDPTTSARSSRPDQTPLLVEGRPPGLKQVHDDLRDSQRFQVAGDGRGEFVRPVQLPGARRETPRPRGRARDGRGTRAARSCHPLSPHDHLPGEAGEGSHPRVHDSCTVVEVGGSRSLPCPEPMEAPAARGRADGRGGDAPPAAPRTARGDRPGLDHELRLAGPRSALAALPPLVPPAGGGSPAAERARGGSDLAQAATSRTASFSRLSEPCRYEPQARIRSPERSARTTLRNPLVGS